MSDLGKAISVLLVSEAMTDRQVAARSIKMTNDLQTAMGGAITLFTARNEPLSPSAQTVTKPSKPRESTLGKGRKKIRQAIKEKRKRNRKSR